MTPKQLARLARFETAQRRIQCDPSPCFTRLAHELGYADQAHFTREFRVFADLTPTLYLAEARDFWRRQGDVAFLQA